MTIRDRVSKQIAEKFQGTKDEGIGFQRITKAEDSTSRMTIDEWTAPEDIIFNTKSLLDQIEQIPMTVSDTSAEMYALKNQMLNYERGLAVQKELSEQEVQDIIDIYNSSYRLNRRVVHKECVVTKPKEMGYWALFAPYFM